MYTVHCTLWVHLSAGSWHAPHVAHMPIWEPIHTTRDPSVVAHSSASQHTHHLDATRRWFPSRP